jgi:TonB family protein
MNLDKWTTAVLALFFSLAQGALAQSVSLSGNGAASSGCGAANLAYHPMVPSNTDPVVVLSVRINKSGDVHDVQVVSGPSALTETAIKAAKRWKYDWVNGTPSERTTLAVTLKEGAAPKVQEVMQAGVPGCIPFPARIRVSQNFMASRLLSRVEPVYPPEAKNEHVAGIVVLRATIDKGGSVNKAENVSGPPALVPAAMDAVKQWKYEPYLIGGESVEVETTVEVSFTL